ncbi:hypothetical protein COU95_00420 [Candidatus Shapirobacteria bacterium CG10_big_fil_rev_8_21_14_0_10_40_9]|uniref:7-cyano-7-deazaguanine synthase n=1 Tax=Candidatus Shapirobacteria bacterium CG10_big_fil_rev_8_21_14_0_10_40_9 TaxID=1974888 RepID=A0A2M8L4L3_9BACT|nr:MAG: hypothetical protein COU95_00420 [Candidatus Shapirobacteria bacterium CG10_big_fil_rev_8_21_14_0_10_40_9]
MRLNKISEKEFLSRLKKRRLEDLETIRVIEDFLLKKRGYVFRMPPPGSPVILLVSGGMDSITSWGISMEEFGLKVYPLSFDKGEKRRKKEEASLNFFSEFYSKRYPDLFVRPFKLSVDLRKISIPIEKATKILHPQIILDNLDSRGNISLNLSLGSFTLLPFYAMLFSRYLLSTQNIKIKTIFCSVTKGDDVPSQTLTALRITMMAMCVASREYDWQFSSAVFEKETRLFFSKADLVSWAEEEGIPLEKTWSCYRDFRYQCGDCIACYMRIKAFRKAGVADRTLYLSPFAPYQQKLRFEVARFLRSIGIDPKILKALYKKIFKGA